MTKSKTYAMRIDKEHEEVLEKRAAFLNKEVPEGRDSSVGTLVSYVANKAVAEYVEMLNEKGIDYLLPIEENSKNMRRKLASILESKAQQLRDMTEFEFSTTRGGVLYEEANDALRAIGELGMRNDQKVLESIKFSTSCELISDTIEVVK